MPDPMSIYRRARYAFTASATLMMSVRGSGGNKMATGQIEPGVYLSAFALELYLKCLGQLSKGAFPRSHDLGQLYRHLERVDQEQVKQLYDAIRHSEGMTFYLLKQPKGEGVAVKIGDRKNLNPQPIIFQDGQRGFGGAVTYGGLDFSIDTVLGMAADTFEKWRYSFEGELTTAYGLVELGEALDTHIIRKRPDFILPGTRTRAVSLPPGEPAPDDGPEAKE